MKKFCATFILFFLIFVSSSYPESWEEYKQAVLYKHQGIDGWCSREKASLMMDLVYEIKPDVCVEIGVYGGSSFFPTAKALEYIEKGALYGIDPWSNKDAIQGYDPTDANYKWWGSLDLKNIHLNFLALFYANSLENRSHLFHMASREASLFFDQESIDILHIDGNHAHDAVLDDVKVYLPKVKQGGYIWLNDGDWESVVDAAIYLFEHCEYDMERSYNNSCLLFKKL